MFNMQTGHPVIDEAFTAFDAVAETFHNQTCGIPYVAPEDRVTYDEVMALRVKWEETIHEKFPGLISREKGYKLYRVKGQYGFRTCVQVQMFDVPKAA